MSFTDADYQALLVEFSRLSDERYRAFQSSLVPGTVITYGVRIPALRSTARTILREDPAGFLACSRADSYEETMLRGMVIAGLKTSLSDRLPLVRAFLPLIDNWAVCDCFCTSFKLKKSELPLMWEFIRPFFDSPEEYTARFAIVMFLDHFITEPYLTEGLAILPEIRHEGYYVKMAVAWALSVCFIKFREPTLVLLESHRLDTFTQNKTIQKIRESLRASAEDKALLQSLRALP